MDLTVLVGSKLQIRIDSFECPLSKLTHKSALRTNQFAVLTFLNNKLLIFHGVVLKWIASTSFALLCHGLIVVMCLLNVLDVRPHPNKSLKPRFSQFFRFINKVYCFRFSRPRRSFLAVNVWVVSLENIVGVRPYSTTSLEPRFSAFLNMNQHFFALLNRGVLFWRRICMKFISVFM